MEVALALGMNPPRKGQENVYRLWLQSHNMSLANKVSLCSNRGEQKEGCLCSNTSERMILRKLPRNPVWAKVGIGKGPQFQGQQKKEREKRRIFGIEKKYWEGRVSSNGFAFLSLCIWNIPDVMCSTHA